jgi:hypothetical protein
MYGADFVVPMAPLKPAGVVVEVRYADEEILASGEGQLLQFRRRRLCDGFEPSVAAVYELLARNPRVLKEPEPYVGVAPLGDSSITIAIRPWVSAADYMVAQAELNQAIIERFRASHIEIPFPQREVRLLGGS